jgi:hypothetical protein
MSGQFEISTAIWVAFTFQAVVCGVLCSRVASAKNLHYIDWFLAGLVCVVFALIAVARMPSAIRRETVRRAASFDNEGALLSADRSYVCPHCAKDVAHDATSCTCSIEFTKGSGNNLRRKALS